MASRTFDRISVFYPRGTRTGGPEALHQLVDALRRNGQDAVLVPIPGTERAPRVHDYEVYDAPEDSVARDRDGDAIVCPEVWVGAVLRKGPAQRFLWWLSVDNAAFLAQPGHSPTPVGSMATAPRLGHVRHLAQSAYARTFVEGWMGVEAQLLSDYTTAVAMPPLHAGRRGPLICYNVAKGGETVRRTRQHVGSAVAWQPIVGMSRQQALRTMSRSDVYLDLGHHPGKDRMPREAASVGAISLVLRVGAGANSDDYAIPSDHRIDAEGDVDRNAAAVVDHVLQDLDLNYQRQAAFRHCVRSERESFDREVRAVFGPSDG